MDHTAESILEKFISLHEAIQNAAPDFDAVLPRAEEMIDLVSDPNVMAVVTADEDILEEIQNMTFCARLFIIMTLFGHQLTTDEQGETGIEHDSKPHDDQHVMGAASDKMDEKKTDAV